MNDRFTDILFITLLLLLTGVFISWSFVVEPQWGLRGEGTVSGETFSGGALQGLNSLFSPTEPRGDMSTELTERLRSGVTAHVNAHDVEERAGRALEDSASPEVRARSITVLQGALSAFRKSIAETEWRVNRAREERSRSDAEIRKAEEALGRMRNGADTVTRQLERADPGGAR
ncbi:MAG: hypothetical protein KBA61_13470 [Spirochaetes bacterium]|nr:hypothetical protein [Spirochaetota bacterium]